MKALRQSICTFGIIAIVSSLAVSTAFAAGKPKKILFFSKSSGYEHSTIKVTDGQPSFAEKVLAELGQKNNLEFTFTKDGRVFTPENIAKYDAFFFYTTGDLTETGTDGNPPMSKEGKAAFLEAIRKGKGFIGTHSASDTFHSPGNKDLGPARYQDDGTNVDPYVTMLGGEFIVHGAQQAGPIMKCADPKFPGLSNVPPDFGPLEEWYSLKNFAPDLHVLLYQETGPMDKGGVNSCYHRPPYPATWAHLYGKGRVFYTSMGHNETVWTNPVFQQVLLGGINWAVGNAKANIKPNLTKVAPQASTLPPPN
jgi:type 1 glutamine amidotransferase